LKERIKKYRPKVDVLVVHGGDEVINRIAVGERMVDVLNHPRNGLNHVVARLAAKNKVAIGFDIGNIIHKRGGARSKALSEMRKNLILARRYGTPIILSSNAHSIYDLRAPREVIALTRLFGMKREEAVRALSEIPSMIVEKVMMNGK
jgi:ribonuclease P/MRP protein subunit RPP1